MTGNPSTPIEDDVIAAEYVLGVLNYDGRRETQRRMRTDAGFAEHIRQWELRFEGLNDDFGSLTPPSRVKAQIDRRLFASQRNYRGVWNWIAGATVTIMFGLGFVAWQFNGDVSPDIKAELIGEQGSVVVSVDRDRGLLSISSQLSGLPVGSVFELWAVQDDAPPVSLGTFVDDKSLPLRLTLTKSSTLAVSIEPQGGSPTGAPTGAVIAVGALQDV